MFFTLPKPVSVLEGGCRILHAKQYSYRTEETHLARIKRFILFHNKRYPRAMGMPEMLAFLCHLAAQPNGAAFTQNQAPAAKTEKAGSLGPILWYSNCPFGTFILSYSK